MKIPVIFDNGSVGSILVDDLDKLLEKKKVVGFHRASGWAIIYKDEFRSGRTDKGSWKDRKHNRLLIEI